MLLALQYIYAIYIYIFSNYASGATICHIYIYIATTMLLALQYIYAIYIYIYI